MLKVFRYSLFKVLSFLFLFINTICFAQEEVEIVEYSYSELFQMIDEETDTIFYLSNAQITVDTVTDQKYIIDPQELMNTFTQGRTNKIQPTKTIDKHLKFENVNFENDDTYNWFNSAIGEFANIHFKKKLTCTNVYGLKIFDSQFEENVVFRWNKNFSKNLNKSILLTNNHFNGSFRMDARITANVDLEQELQFFLMDNVFDQDESERTILLWDNTILWNFGLLRNKFIGKGFVSLNSIEPKMVEITGNIFTYTPNIAFLIADLIPTSFRISENQFKKHVNFGITNPSPSLDIEWKQFENKLFSENGRNFQFEELMSGANVGAFRSFDDQIQMSAAYKDKYRIQNNKAFKAEMALRGEFFNYFKSRFDKESSNAVYMELKDLETARLQYIYNKSPSFNRYFKWKINQFLKVFSDYGTNPAKSIIFSIYVIFLFGAFYLFFPNSWDSHGKNRIMHRYSFFMKYMVKDTGMHEVYLDEKQKEFDEYNTFSKVIEESQNKVPRFFTSSSILLLKWAKSGSVFSSFLLKRIDVMKGKWASLSNGRKIWKSALLISVFLLALIYDIFIKMLNALMLSINTFTTLGFGEIPIKGLPRYMAIVQGFVGWFLLTIFSVSLISQLME